MIIQSIYSVIVLCSVRGMSDQSGVEFMCCNSLRRIRISMCQYSATYLKFFVQLSSRFSRFCASNFPNLLLFERAKFNFESLFCEKRLVPILLSIFWVTTLKLLQLSQLYIHNVTELRAVSEYSPLASNKAIVAVAHAFGRRRSMCALISVLRL